MGPVLQKAGVADFVAEFLIASWSSYSYWNCLRFDFVNRIWIAVVLAWNVIDCPYWDYLYECSRGLYNQYYTAQF